MTRRSRSFGAVIGALTALPAAAAAQSDADFEMGELTQADEAYILAARPYADCLVQSRAKEIPKFLGTGSGVEALSLDRQMARSHPDCARPKSSNRNVEYLSGAILEAMIRREFGETPAPASFDQVPPFIYVKDTSSPMLREMYANFMDPYDCTTRRAPGKVQAFLRTEPLSAQEGVAFANLKEALVACHPKGEKWVLRAHAARPYLAETFYTLMKVDQRRKASAH